MTSWRAPLIALLLLIATASPPVAEASAPAAPAASEIRIGPNLILVPDANARSVTGWLIVLAGCADEANGQCRGIAHYVEHLLFINRDNDHRPKVALFPEGTGNGWTSHRSTTYLQRFPSRPETNAERLDLLMGYFAGLLSDIRADRTQAERERSVVMQEYQQNTGRNPFARFQIALNLELMPGEPLGQRVIGSPQTIEAFTLEAARAFHDRWYARNNAVIVLHGPLDRDIVEVAYARHVAPLPAKQVPPHAWKQPRRYETEQRVMRSTEKDARQAGIYLERVITFDETAGQRDENDAANSVLAAYLASRLPGSPLDVLVEKEGLVTDARLSVSRVRDGAFRISFSASPADGVSADRVVEAARSYLADLATAGLPAATVDRLKQRITNQRALLAEQPTLYAQSLVSWIGAHLPLESWTSRQARHETVTVASVARLLSIIAGPAREIAGVIMPSPPSVAANARDRGPAAASPIPSLEPIPQGAGPQ